ncbi:hypothetical protein BO99DRAFT_407452 [Aspergillus violaceofuscus CBS 115571]|uniref:Uncharacterized protein n=1 Tax=Aspergillus violaceofuscus (strain CBS 115571) TaxID=1450538 RepID=A0A2V5HNK6_ASPV1|nr:hypothetical protein BO99DRAFT_407452 [Aspergillus violaceofuscus CBS 115571]
MKKKNLEDQIGQVLMGFATLSPSRMDPLLQFCTRRSPLIFDPALFAALKQLGLFILGSWLVALYPPIYEVLSSLLEAWVWRALVFSNQLGRHSPSQALLQVDVLGA